MTIFPKTYHLGAISLLRLTSLNLPLGKCWFLDTIAQGCKKSSRDLSSKIYYNNLLCPLSYNLKIQPFYFGYNDGECTLVEEKSDVRPVSQRFQSPQSYILLLKMLSKKFRTKHQNSTFPWKRLILLQNGCHKNVPLKEKHIGMSWCNQWVLIS